MAILDFQLCKKWNDNSFTVWVLQFVVSKEIYMYCNVCWNFIQQGCLSWIYEWHKNRQLIEDHLRNIQAKFAFKWFTSFKEKLFQNIFSKCSMLNCPSLEVILCIWYTHTKTRFFFIKNLPMIINVQFGFNQVEKIFVSFPTRYVMFNTLSCYRGNLGFPIKKSKNKYKVMKETFLPCITFITCLSVKRIQNFRQFPSIVDPNSNVEFPIDKNRIKCINHPRPLSAKFCSILSRVLREIKIC